MTGPSQVVVQRTSQSKNELFVSLATKRCWKERMLVSTKLYRIPPKLQSKEIFPTGDISDLIHNHVIKKSISERGVALRASRHQLSMNTL